MKKMTDQQKITEMNQALQTFSSDFGEHDVIKQTFFDLLVEAIYGVGKNLPVPSEEKQERDHDIDDVGRGDMPTYEIE